MNLNWTLPELTHIVAQLKTYMPIPRTSLVILERDLIDALAASGYPLTQPELDHHMLNDLLAQAMFMNGYTNQRNGTYLENIPEFRNSADRYQWAHTYTKEISLLTHKLPSLALAHGMKTYTPTCIVDEEFETIITLQMLGPEQSVKANWAALVGGGKTHWINNCTIKLGGSKNHHIIKQKYLAKSGWAEYWLIHHQASFETAVPTSRIYLIHNNIHDPIPASFYEMISTILGTPTRPAWTQYLWLNGRSQNLIYPIHRANCRGSLAWTIHPAEATWNKIITTGLQENRIKMA